MRWGFVGLGQMGLPMARRLAQVVDLTAHDPARDAADGLRLVPRARDLAPCDVLVTCLPNGDVVETVLFGPEGLAEALSPGAVVIDTSTTTHAAALRMSARLGDLGIGFLDAPVSGMQARAEDGTLSIMPDLGRGRAWRGQDGGQVWALRKLRGSSDRKRKGGADLSHSADRQTN